MTSPLLADRVQETTTTTGTGTLTLGGAITGCRTFNSAFSNGNVVYYVIDDGAGAWEVGSGTVGTGTLTRDTVYVSSNSGSKVNFSAGTKNVYCDAPANVFPTGNIVGTSDTQTLTNKTLVASGSNTVEATSGPTSSQLAGNRNKIINGNFNINQRSVSGTVNLSAGAYGHDRFKAGASGCTYTFSTSGNVTTITISSGTLQQVIEGINIETGTYVLSWFGTAQGKINSGSYGASGAVTASLTGGSNQTIEFNTGTLTLIQLEKSATATPFENRLYGTELALCQRYYFKPAAAYNNYPVLHYGAIVYTNIPLPITMRTTPTVIDATGSTYYEAGGTYTYTPANTLGSSANGVSVNGNVSGGTSGYVGTAYTNFTASAEL